MAAAAAAAAPLTFPPLEKDLMSRVAELMSQPGVRGVLVTDLNGLCIAAQGELHSKSSGFVTSLAHQAQEMVGVAETEVPTVCVECEGSNVFVRKDGPIILAVMKNKPAPVA